MKNQPHKIESIDKSMFVRCDCYGHSLEVRRDVELVDGVVSYKNFEVCIWERYGGNEGKMSVRERIRWCWYVLTKGKPWADQVTISDEKARSLAEFILTEEKQQKRDC